MPKGELCGFCNEFGFCKKKWFITARESALQSAERLRQTGNASDARLQENDARRYEERIDNCPA